MRAFRGLLDRHGFEKTESILDEWNYVKGWGGDFVARYSDDDNVSDTGTVTVRIPGRSLAGARCHLTDLVRTYTEVPLELRPDGSAKLRMMPLSFALIEL